MRLQNNYKTSCRIQIFSRYEIYYKTISPEYEQIIYLAPSYYSHVPPFVITCMKDVVYTEKQRVCLICACGGNRGRAIEDMRATVRDSQKEVALEYMLWMPGSYILSYNAFPKWYQNMTFFFAERKVKRIAKDIKNRKEKRPLKKGLFYKEKNESALQKSIASYNDICAQYTVADSCIGCGTCARVCPTNNISIKDKKPVFAEECNQCMACIQWCPKRAIDFENKAATRNLYHHKDVSLKDMMINRI